MNLALPVQQRTQRIAFVALAPDPDGGELGPLELPSYGVHRVLAAANAYLGLKVGMTVSASIPAAVREASALDLPDGHLHGLRH